MAEKTVPAVAEKPAPVSHKDQLVAINTALKELKEIEAKLTGVLEKHYDTTRWIALRERSECAHKWIAAYEKAKDTRYLVELHKDLTHGGIEVEAVAKENPEVARKAVEALDAQVSALVSKSPLPRKFYARVSGYLEAVKAMKSSLIQSKAEGRFQSGVEIITGAATFERRGAQETKSTTFPKVKEFAAKVEESAASISAKAKEEIGELAQQMQLAESIVAKCKELEGLWGKQVFPDELLAALRSRREDLEGRVDAANEELREVKFAEAALALRMYHGRHDKNESGGLPEMLEVLKSQIEAVEGELKELKETEEKTAPG